MLNMARIPCVPKFIICYLFISFSRDNKGLENADKTK